MTQIERAISAVRGEMRHTGLDPEACTANDAHNVLDDLYRRGIEAAAWYGSTSDSQLTKFYRGWNKWLKSCQE